MFGVKISNVGCDLSDVHFCVASTDWSALAVVVGPDRALHVIAAPPAAAAVAAMAGATAAAPSLLLRADGGADGAPHMLNWLQSPPLHTRVQDVVWSRGGMLYALCEGGMTLLIAHLGGDTDGSAAPLHPQWGRPTPHSAPFRPGAWMLALPSSDLSAMAATGRRDGVLAPVAAAQKEISSRSFAGMSELEAVFRVQRDPARDGVWAQVHGMLMALHVHRATAPYPGADHGYGFTVHRRVPIRGACALSSWTVTRASAIVADAESNELRAWDVAGPSAVCTAHLPLPGGAAVRVCGPGLLCHNDTGTPLAIHDPAVDRLLHLDVTSEGAAASLRARQRCLRPTRFEKGGDPAATLMRRRAEVGAGVAEVQPAWGDFRSRFDAALRGLFEAPIDLAHIVPGSAPCDVLEARLVDVEAGRCLYLLVRRGEILSATLHAVADVGRVLRQRQWAARDALYIRHTPLEGGGFGMGGLTFGAPLLTRDGIVALAFERAAGVDELARVLAHRAALPTRMLCRLNGWDASAVREAAVLLASRGEESAFRAELFSTLESGIDTLDLCLATLCTVHRILADRFAELSPEEAVACERFAGLLRAAIDFAGRVAQRVLHMMGASLAAVPVDVAERRGAPAVLGRSSTPEGQRRLRDDRAYQMDVARVVVALMEAWRRLRAGVAGTAAQRAAVEWGFDAIMDAAPAVPPARDAAAATASTAAAGKEPLGAGAIVCGRRAHPDADVGLTRHRLCGDMLQAFVLHGSQLAARDVLNWMRSLHHAVVTVAARDAFLAALLPRVPYPHVRAHMAAALGDAQTQRSFTGATAFLLAGAMQLLNPHVRPAQCAASFADTCGDQARAAVAARPLSQLAMTPLVGTGAAVALRRGETASSTAIMRAPRSGPQPAITVPSSVAFSFASTVAPEVLAGSDLFKAVTVLFALIEDIAAEAGRAGSTEVATMWRGLADLVDAHLPGAVSGIPDVAGAKRLLHRCMLRFALLHQNSLTAAALGALLVDGSTSWVEPIDGAEVKALLANWSATPPLEAQAAVIAEILVSSVVCSEAATNAAVSLLQEAAVTPAPNALPVRGFGASDTTARVQSYLRSARGGVPSTAASALEAAALLDIDCATGEWGEIPSDAADTSTIFYRHCALRAGAPRSVSEFFARADDAAFARAGAPVSVRALVEEEARDVGLDPIRTGGSTAWHSRTCATIDTCAAATADTDGGAGASSEAVLFMPVNAEGRRPSDQEVTAAIAAFAAGRLGDVIGTWALTPPCVVVRRAGGSSSAEACDAAGAAPWPRWQILLREGRATAAAKAAQASEPAVTLDDAVRACQEALLERITPRISPAARAALEATALHFLLELGHTGVAQNVVRHLLHAVADDDSHASSDSDLDEAAEAVTTLPVARETAFAPWLPLVGAEDAHEDMIIERHARMRSDAGRGYHARLLQHATILQLPPEEVSKYMVDVPALARVTGTDDERQEADADAAAAMALRVAVSGSARPQPAEVHLHATEGTAIRDAILRTVAAGGTSTGALDAFQARLASAARDAPTCDVGAAIIALEELTAITPFPRAMVLACLRELARDVVEVGSTEAAAAVVRDVCRNIVAALAQQQVSGVSASAVEAVLQHWPDLGTVCHRALCVGTSAMRPLQVLRAIAAVARVWPPLYRAMFIAGPQADAADALLSLDEFITLNPTCDPEAALALVAAWTQEAAVAAPPPLGYAQRVQAFVASHASAAQVERTPTQAWSDLTDRFSELSGPFGVFSSQSERAAALEDFCDALIADEIAPTPADAIKLTIWLVSRLLPAEAVASDMLATLSTLRLRSVRQDATASAQTSMLAQHALTLAGCSAAAFDGRMLRYILHTALCRDAVEATVSVEVGAAAIETSTHSSPKQTRQLTLSMRSAVPDLDDLITEKPRLSQETIQGLERLLSGNFFLRQWVARMFTTESGGVLAALNAITKVQAGAKGEQAAAGATGVSSWTQRAREAANVVLSKRELEALTTPASTPQHAAELAPVLVDAVRLAVSAPLSLWGSAEEGVASTAAAQMGVSVGHAARWEVIDTATVAAAAAAATLDADQPTTAAPGAAPLGAPGAAHSPIVQAVAVGLFASWVYPLMLAEYAHAEGEGKFDGSRRALRSFVTKALGPTGTTVWALREAASSAWVPVGDEVWARAASIGTLVDSLTELPALRPIGGCTAVISALLHLIAQAEDGVADIMQNAVIAARAFVLALGLRCLAVRGGWSATFASRLFAELSDTLHAAASVQFFECIGRIALTVDDPTGVLPPLLNKLLDPPEYGTTFVTLLRHQAAYEEAVRASTAGRSRHAIAARPAVVPLHRSGTRLALLQYCLALFDFGISVGADEHVLFEAFGHDAPLALSQEDAAWALLKALNESSGGKNRTAGSGSATSQKRREAVLDDVVAAFDLAARQYFAAGLYDGCMRCVRVVRLLDAQRTELDAPIIELAVRFVPTNDQPGEDMQRRATAVQVVANMQDARAILLVCGAVGLGLDEMSRVFLNVCTAKKSDKKKEDATPLCVMLAQLYAQSCVSVAPEMLTRMRSYSAGATTMTPQQIKAWEAVLETLDPKDS